jgi:Flp pilus assembly protein TadD
VRLAPDDATSHLRLGEALAAAGQRDAARDSLRRARDLGSREAGEALKELEAAAPTKPH